MQVSNGQRSIVVLGLSGLVVIAAITAFQVKMPWDKKSLPVGRSWDVISVAGTASYRLAADAPWVALGANMSIGAGADVRVGTSSELVMSDAGDIITVDERSFLNLPRNTTRHNAGVTQERGRVHYEIESVPSRLFEVETPYLAITVKGTAFVVDVDEQDTIVGVEHGQVDVDTYDGRYRVALSQGQTARKAADADAPLEFRSGQDTAPEIVPVAPAVTEPRPRRFAQYGYETGSARSDLTSSRDLGAETRRAARDDRAEAASTMSGKDGAAMAVSTVIAALTAILVTTLIAAVSTRLRSRGKASDKHAGHA
ncbi:MAG: FecR family protein [Pseudomonadota bacterium]